MGLSVQACGGGVGGATDTLTSPDTLKDLSVSNINLLYSDGSYARLYIDDTESRLTSTIVMSNLPTAAAGLPAGGLWDNGGVLNVA